MMSGHSANPIFFNKKRTLAKLPTPLLPIKSHFCLTSNPPPQNGRHMCITPYADFYFGPVNFFIITGYYICGPNIAQISQTLHKKNQGHY